MAFSSIGGLLHAVIQFYSILIVIYVLMSWIPSNDGFAGELRAVLGTLCEPYVGLFRRILPMAVVGGAGLDLSPFIALIVLQLIGNFIPR
jgi:YggT family protein